MPNHVSVMPQEVMRLLDVQPGSVVVDGTLGMAGHASLIAKALHGKGHLIGIDRDATSLKLAREHLKSFSVRIDLLQGSFFDAGTLLDAIDVNTIDAVVLDLGISSFQLDDPNRGFAFKTDGPLDMRMDQDQKHCAADLVNTCSEEELARIIEEYGEDRFAKRIAKAICFYRASERITTTGQLALIVLKALPKGYQRGRIHPATRTFQALRIAVNEELQDLGAALERLSGRLNNGGRMCVIAFHSLEDRIVKNTFKRLAEDGGFKLLTKKPLMPSEEEETSNPRARSARLRAIEKNES